MIKTSLDVVLDLLFFKDLIYKEFFYVTKLNNLNIGHSQE